MIYQLDRARSLDRVAKERGTIAAIHVKIDTGMGRIGVRYDEVAAFAESLKRCEHLRVEGMMTHFAAADDLRQNAFTSLQVERFSDAVRVFRSFGHNPAYLDLANSPGAVAHPDARGNMVRLGGVLYGLGGDVLPSGIEKPELRPVLALKTRVAFIKKIHAGETVGYSRTYTADREVLTATLPIGYQDGYNRLLSNKGRVIIRGHYAPVIGRISMDWTIADVSAIPGVQESDEVVLIGSSDGAHIAAEDVARAIGTISYEVTCAVDRRVERVFLPVA